MTLRGCLIFDFKSWTCKGTAAAHSNSWEIFPQTLHIPLTKFYPVLLHIQLLTPCHIWSSITHTVSSIITLPGVAGAVLQTALFLWKWIIHDHISQSLKLSHAYINRAKKLELGQNVANMKGYIQNLKLFWNCMSS